MDNNKFCNIIFFSYDNKEEASKFLKLFVEKSEENAYARSNSDYPFFVFFKTKDFSEEILYSYYLDKEKESEISSFYHLKSHIYFKSDFDAIKSYNIKMLLMGQSGCGKSTFVNYLLGKSCEFSASINNLLSLGKIYNHTNYPLSIKELKGFVINYFEKEKKIFDLLEINIRKYLMHIVLYLIPGPYNLNRDLDYSCISTLLILEEYNIHYYLIMTKDPEEKLIFVKLH